MSAAPTFMPVDRVARRADFAAVSRWLFLAGSLVQVASYRSIEPVIVGSIFFIAGLAILRFTPLGGRYEIPAFRLIFAVCWFWAGVAAVYANQFDDQSQNYSDAATFFMLANGEGGALTVSDLAFLTEGAGAVVVWQAVYNFFYSIGIEKGRFVGITVNVFFVALSGVVGVKACAAVFGLDDRRLRRFIILFALCPLFWLFGTVHLRDSAVLLGVSVLALVWARFTARLTFGNLLWLLGTTLLSLAYFGLLRREFIFVPGVMLAAGTAALILEDSAQPRRRILIIAAVVVAIPALAVIFLRSSTELVTVLVKGNTQYEDLGGTLETADESLGRRLIVQAPLPVRLVLGSAYLFVQPIPAWAGFQNRTAYHLYKTLQVPFMLVVVPLMLLAIWRILAERSMRTAPLLLMAMLSVGLTLAIAGTSLETRHLGSFLLPILVLAVMPDTAVRRDRNAFRRLFGFIVPGMFVVHVAWVIMKVL